MVETAVDKKWYVVRTYSGHENKVKAYLESEVAQAGLQEKIAKVLVPSEKVFEVKDGKKKSKTKNFFPGYILVEAVLDKKTNYILLNTPPLMSFVGSKEKPVPWPPDVGRSLIGKNEHDDQD